MRLLFFIALSLIFLHLDTQQRLGRLHEILNKTTVAPLQRVVDAPIRLFQKLRQNLITQEDLLSKNMELRAQLLFQEVRLQKLTKLERENSQLYLLFQSIPYRSQQKTLLAHLLHANTDPLASEAIVDKGTRSGIMVGQAVLDGDGVIGRVLEANETTSRILLITDQRSAVPVEDQRSGVRGILNGQGHFQSLTLKDMPMTVDIKKNDLLVTSGLGGYYPAGYPIGIVSSITINSTEQFTKIMVKPNAVLNRNKPVLIILSS